MFECWMNVCKPENSSNETSDFSSKISSNIQKKCWMKCWTGLLRPLIMSVDHYYNHIILGDFNMQPNSPILISFYAIFKPV